MLDDLENVVQHIVYVIYSMPSEAVPCSGSPWWFYYHDMDFISCSNGSNTDKKYVPSPVRLEVPIILDEDDAWQDKGNEPQCTRRTLRSRQAAGQRDFRYQSPMCLPRA